MTPPPPRSLCAAPPGAHDDTACSLGYTLPAPALRVWTARISYQGADRLDITRKSAGPDGLLFAPSWAILRPAFARLQGAKHHRRMVVAEYEGCFDEAAERARHAAEAERLEALAWGEYVPAYTAEMRASWRANRERWDALLARQEVTLVCYCTDAEHCHRRLLASMLVKCGAIYMGER